jgi:hypothetical protein
MGDTKTSTLVVEAGSDPYDQNLLVLPSTNGFDNQDDYLHHQYHQINNLTNSHLVSPLVRHGLRRGPNRKGITSFLKKKYSLYSKPRKSFGSLFSD